MKAPKPDPKPPVLLGRWDNPQLAADRKGGPATWRALPPAHCGESTKEASMTTAITLEQVAGEANEWFERRTRDDSDTFVTLKDDAPQWVRDMVYDAHGDLLPEDWRYSAIWSAVQAIADSGAETVEDCDDLDGEYADGMVDVYTFDRLKWLSSHLSRPSYCDEAAEEFGTGEMDIVERIGMGQYMEAREVFSSVLQSLGNELQSREQ